MAFSLDFPKRQTLNVSLNQSVPLENRLRLKKKSVVSKANLKRLSKLLPPYESFRWLLMRPFAIVQFERCSADDHRDQSVL